VSLTPGFHALPATEYFADPCAQPSLSASIAKILLQESPRKAWFSHPRLNKDYREEHDAKFDIGTAAHSLLLEGDDVMRVIEADDWRTKAAKEQRAESRAMGKLPVLAHQAAGVRAMVGAARKFLSECEITEYWNEADSEVTVIWQEGSVWLRSRLDRLARNHRCVMDYKSTTDVSPDGFGRQITRMGYHIQEAFYRRAVRSQVQRDPSFVFLAQSVEAPYECSLHGCDPALQQIADAEVDRAVQLWRVCLTTNKWSSYGPRIHWAMPTNWMIQEHEMRLAA
jgi:hypothetical protein